MDPSTENASNLAGSWQDSFLQVVQEPEAAAPLREAALSGALGDWTAQLTAVVVLACESIGWKAAAKGFPL